MARGRKILIADSSTAEFGWELMSWQGHIRKKASEFDDVIICTTGGLEPLYSDFTASFITHNVGMIRDCTRASKIFGPGGWKQYCDAIARRIRDERALSNEVTILKFTKYIPPDQQSFICYGDALCAKNRGDQFDVLIHARNKKSQNSYYDVYNWPVERWDEVVEELHRRGLRVGAVGTQRDALLPEHAEELRGIELDRLMDIMAASCLIAGPSSGPMHLAALCGLPRLVWATDQWSTSTQMDDRVRYTERWNPFRTPCLVFTDNTEPTAERMLEDLNKAIEGQDHLMDPGAESASRMTKYWAGRRKKQGRDYVSRNGNNSDHQVDILVPELHSLLEGREFKHGIDFGCGWGRFSKDIFQHCEKLRCVDLIADFRNDLPPAVSFEQLSFPTKIDMPNDSIDLLVAITSLQHIVDEHWFVDVMAELRRVLALGATVLIVDDNGRNGEHVKVRSAKLFAEYLDLDLSLAKPFSMDHRKSHHILMGTCRE